jgi:hypothetical protein
MVPVGADEADAVRLVRNYFHRTMKLLADETADWFIPDEEARKLAGAQGGS